ncbi:MAG UNVERIFIED_CONTAM: peptide deformylase [Planctomycetaceae bacterium]
MENRTNRLDFLVLQSRATLPADLGCSHENPQYRSPPAPALRRKCREVKKIDAELRDMVQQMFQLMYQARGVGLAANQCGLPYRLFVINPEGDPECSESEMVFINPRITRRRGGTDGEEGCLSLPELYATVPRALQIVVDAFDLSRPAVRNRTGRFPCPGCAA